MDRTNPFQMPPLPKQYFRAAADLRLSEVDGSKGVVSILEQAMLAIYSGTASPHSIAKRTTDLAKKEGGWRWERGRIYLLSELGREPQERELTELLLRNVLRTTYNLFRWSQITGMRQFLPYVSVRLLRKGMENRAPCGACDGDIRRQDDPTLHWPPCDHLECACTLEAIDTEEALARKGEKA
jgi:hypothetical protein